MAFRKGKILVIIMTLCALILMRMVDFAVFDSHGNDNEHNSSKMELSHTDLDHEDLDENALQHANDHALHDMYHSVSSIYIQPTVVDFPLQKVDAGLTTTRYNKISKTISFIPPVPPPLV